MQEILTMNAKRIFYITRTYPNKNFGGGAIIRRGTVDHLRKNGYDVWIISPNYDSLKIDIDKECKHILLPCLGNFKICAFLEAIGLWDDYMMKWVHCAIRFLKDIIKERDLLFATSGGELGSIILAKKLADIIGCKYVVNLHDPISFTTINGEVLRYIKARVGHVIRDSAEQVYLSRANAIITSSESYGDCLKRKYPALASRISCHHFGYIESFQISSKGIGEQINIVYGGAMGKVQSPEILAEAANGIDGVKVTYIGDWQNNPKLLQYRKRPNIELINALSNEKYIAYLQDNADVGFVSLRGQLSELCIPSKLYEFINLGIPILGVIKGDGKNIICKNHYGAVADFSPKSLRNAILEMIRPERLSLYKRKIIKDREMWAMDCQIKDVLLVLDNI